MFVALVAGVWSGALGLGLLEPRLGLPPAGPNVFGLLSFLVAGAFVIEGSLRLRRGVATMLRLEHERATLARFVLLSTWVALRPARVPDPIEGSPS